MRETQNWRSLNGSAFFIVGLSFGDVAQNFAFFVGCPRLVQRIQRNSATGGVDDDLAKRDSFRI
jgi:hypothetical protein